MTKGPSNRCQPRFFFFFYHKSLIFVSSSRLYSYTNYRKTQYLFCGSSKMVGGCIYNFPGFLFHGYNMAIKHLAPLLNSQSRKEVEDIVGEGEGRTNTCIKSKTKQNKDFPSNSWQTFTCTSLVRTVSRGHCQANGKAGFQLSIVKGKEKGNGTILSE